MDLPELSTAPSRHPDSCLSISTKLIHTLTTIIATNGPVRNDNLILSVGSGSGLLEAHFLDHLTSLSTSAPTFTIQGVEVRSSPTDAPVNKYLPEQHHTTVRGTWELSPLLEATDTLLFVYPRDPSLVNRYLAARPSSLRTVLWLGPRADWEVFGSSFHDLDGFEDVKIVDSGKAGVADFEMVAVVRKR